MFTSRGHVFKSSILFVIAAQDDRVFACDVDADTVICERFCGMEVEYEQKACALKDNHLVAVMLERDISLSSRVSAARRSSIILVRAYLCGGQPIVFAF